MINWRRFRLQSAAVSTELAALQVDQLQATGAPMPPTVHTHPQHGPYDDEPAAPYLTPAERRAALTRAMEDVELGEWDAKVLDWLSGWETSTVIAVAGWIMRARARETEREGGRA